MVLIRSIAFNALFYLNLLVHFIAAIPTLAMPHQAIVAVMKFWAHTNFWLLRVVCGVACEFRGIEKIPKGALLIASKHQSLWETFALVTLFADPAFILKRELMWIPFYGWYAWKAGMIPVSRGKRAQALADMTNSARQELNRGRQILIFPEGTRRAPGAAPAYKFGVAHLYGEPASPACRSRSIPDCSGHAGHFAAIRARSSLKFSIPLHPASPSSNSSMSLRA